MTGSLDDVSRETLDALSEFEKLVVRWNRRINLVSRGDLEHLRARHTRDSAQILSLAPLGAQSWVDLGSGGGFPGVVVATLAREARPELHITLVESDSRKAAFLSTAIHALSLSATVRCVRVEALKGERYDVVSARAFAPCAALFGYAERLLSPSGVGLFPKGERVMEELTEASRSWKTRIERFPSQTNARAQILRVSEISRVERSG